MRKMRMVILAMLQLSKPKALNITNKPRKQHNVNKTA
jgi:hypothetical protein